MATSAAVVSEIPRKPVTRIKTPFAKPNGRPEFTPVPYGGVDELFKKLTHIELYCFLKAQEETYYRESAEVCEAKWARAAQVTAEAIRLALNALEEAKLMPARQRCGKGVRIYPPDFSALKKMEPRPARTCRPRAAAPEPEPKEVVSEEPEAKTAAPEVPKASIECPKCSTVFTISALQVKDLFSQTPSGVGVSPFLRPADTGPPNGHKRNPEPAAPATSFKHNLTPKFDPTVSFRNFWERYQKWNDALPARAREWWNANVKTNEYAAEIFDGLSRWEASQQWADGAIQQAITFLSEHRYSEKPRPAPKSKADEQREATLAILQRNAERRRSNGKPPA